MVFMETGEVWAYRPSPKAIGTPVHRVEIVRIGGPRRYGAVHVRFLDGEEASVQEWVNPGTLVVPWSQVDVFRADDEREVAAAEASCTVRGSTELEAARLVFGFVRPKNRVRLRRGKVDAGVLEIKDLDSTASWLDLDAEELRAAPLLFEDRGGRCIAPWPVTRRLARRVAEKLADEVLQELARRHETLAQDQYHQYSWNRRFNDKERRAEESLLRALGEWCGQEKAERYDELVALRAEVIRLGELVERATKALRDRGHGVIAATIERDLGVHISNLRPGESP